MPAVELPSLFKRVGNPPATRGGALLRSGDDGRHNHDCRGEGSDQTHQGLILVRESPGLNTGASLWSLITLPRL
jgi:hypothetical protein